ncbi:tryptophan halogenase family protein [Asticcacaulis sp. 201]|uniref:tryptophan halogenase family protein n=1 Tax=Asticcacaulis sp. 201 TaxID=3028787 RepID=UPI0029168BC8|nr:tryptophan halogenase family protein [Asticcacaulis sp. 201]MDV6332196.1 tryptophan halogenase family protein [Asticcacaulis sp. 201]
MDDRIRRLVIVGGGTAGWMTAAAFAKILGTVNYDIVLVESEDIGTVGVGEATIPQIRTFNDLLGIDENTFVRETNGTFKLGIHFVDWKRPGESYIHPFGLYGVDMDGIPFTHFWHRLANMGGNGDWGRFNAETMAMRENKFTRIPKGDASGLPQINYAYQFDASLYAAFLRRYAEARGVTRREGRIVRVDQAPESGNLTALHLENGQSIAGDFFIDCSGFRGLLIEQTLKCGYEDWSEWLPCDRAAAVPSAKPDGPITPYTRSTSREAGWQWRIPLQHRTGNGYVFCSEFISEDEACEKLLTRLDGAPLKDPKVLRFTTGHRRKMWHKNVVAFGLASGFLEPLESTSIHLVQAGIAKLLALFPRTGIAQSVVDQYNRETIADYVNVKDFLIAHYKVTEREDTPFWRRCKHMSVPDSLTARLETFRATGQAAAQQWELFKEVSWFSVLAGQGLMPGDYHPVADVISDDDLRQRLGRLRSQVDQRVKGMMSHDDYIAKFCAAPKAA